jgi:hypothetical protein
MSSQSSPSHTSMQVSTALSFLDFPYEIREAVYLQCNLVICCSILLNRPVPTPIALAAGAPRLGDSEHIDYVGIRFGAYHIGPCTRHGIDLFSACPFAGWHRTISKLFLVCRVVSIETRRLVYSRNKFVVHRCAPNGLQILSHFSPSTLSWLTSLRIEINTAITTHTWNNRHFEKNRREFCNCYCNEPALYSEPALYNGYRYCTCHKSDKPIQLSSYRGKQALEEFHEIIRLLSRFIKPGQLDLGVICDSEDVATAETFADAMNGLPQLQDCSIRFSIISDESLRRVARRIVSKLTKTQNIPFDLSRLPMELRWKIFEYMDLIAPEDIEWKASGPRPGYNLHLNYLRNDHNCMPIRGWIHSRSSFAASCKCWTFPLNLFLLNKVYNTMATQIFFSKNHFILIPDRGYTLPGTTSLSFWSHQSPPSYSFFFKHIPRPAIEHLRSIQFVIPMKGEMLSTDHSHSPDVTLESSLPDYWLNSISKLSEYTSLKNLTLILDFSTLDHLPKGENPIYDSRSSWNKRLSQYTNSVIQAIPSGERLNTFYIYLPEEIKLQGLDAEYESLVMGAEYYGGLDEKYLYRNRFTYWYTFITGMVIKENVLTDVTKMYLPLL